MRVDPNYITNLTASVDQSASEEARLASELSSGLRVASLQDDPVAAAQSALLGATAPANETPLAHTRCGTREFGYDLASNRCSDAWL